MEQKQKRTRQAKVVAFTPEQLEADTLFKRKPEPSQPNLAALLEDLHEEIVEARYKLMYALENQVIAGLMDPTEAAQKFSKVNLMPYEQAKRHLLNLGHAQLWAKAL